MRIIDNRTRNLIRFGTLDIGQVFIENVEGDEYTQMKTREIGDKDGLYNAVSLATGELYYIGPDVKVEVVQAELQIE